MNKIAVLILAHKNFNQVQILIEQFDPKYFDIYVHLDKKYSSIIDYKKDNVFYIKDSNRIDIKWGEISMVEAMISLLDASRVNKYKYYWFVSGQDLLIKDSKTIYEELIKEDKNRINFMDSNINKRYQYRSVLKPNSKYASRKIISKVFRTIKFKVTNLVCRIKRTNYVYGSQWSILKNDFVGYLFNEDKLEKYLEIFSNRLIPDESFFQTILKESIYSNDYIDYVLYLDWSEGKNNPKIFTINDKDSIFKTNKYIARKFDIDLDKDIIDYVKENYK